MKKVLASVVFVMVLAGMVFAQSWDIPEEPIAENVVLQLETGSGIKNDDIQRLFTALGTAHLKNNTSYTLTYEVYKDRRRQALRSSLTLTNYEYDSYSVTGLRYGFSNGYFELRFSQSPFSTFVNDEATNSVDYTGVDKRLYDSINEKLQDAAFISRGNASLFKRTSSVSFYIFK